MKTGELIKQLNITYKTELKPTEHQKFLLNDEIGTSRKVYNIFLGTNKKMHKYGFKYLSPYKFSKWFNHHWIKQHPCDRWLKGLASKSIKQAIMDANRSMQRFFKHKSGFPHWRSLKHQDGSYYFVRNSKKQPLRCKRNYIKLPKIGNVQFKEYGYVPYGKKSVSLRSGRVKNRNGHFYVTCIANLPQPRLYQSNGEPIGIDIGIKDMAITSNHHFYKNLNKTRRIKRLYKHVHKVQRHLSRQLESYRKRKTAMQHHTYPTDFRIAKSEHLLRGLYIRICHIMNDYQNKIVAKVVKNKPQYVAIENLNVHGMMKNHHLARAIAHECFYAFREKVIWKCREHGIPIHLVKRFYPSSKQCHNCGYIMNDLKLGDRTYHCPVCGNVLDRDYNAALNIRDTKHYTLLEPSNDYSV